MAVRLLAGFAWKLLIAFQPIASVSSGEFSPFAYSQWLQIDPGQAGDVEYIVIHPVDPNIVVCTSDASGVHLTCNGGQTWVLVNKGLQGGVVRNGTLAYLGGRPQDTPRWDPVDPNWIYVGGGSDLFSGKLRRGTPGRIDWQYLNTLPEGGAIRDLVFDPAPDPAGTGRAQLFYTVTQHGYVAFTSDGGQHFCKITRIPASLNASRYSSTGLPDQKSAFDGWQNPLMTVFAESPRTGRVIGVPCPGHPLVAWGMHNQLDANDPLFRNTQDANYVVNWEWDDPCDPNTGLPDVNITLANGLIVQKLGTGNYVALLSCNNSSGCTGGVYTRVIEDYEWLAGWQLRGSTFTSYQRVISAMTLNPFDPNVCLVGTPRGDTGDPRGIVRSRNILDANPGLTSWQCATNISSMTLGHHIFPSAGHTWAIDIHKRDPNIIFFSCDYVETLKSTNGGTSWQQVYTDSRGTGLWRHRGLCAVHSQSVIFAPSDPNIFFVGRNDGFGCFRTRDQGRSFKKFFCLDWYQANCAPATLTYKTTGVNYTKPSLWFSQTPDPNWWVTGIESNIISGAVHPTDPNRAWFVTFDEPLIHCSLVLKTTDCGDHLTIVLPPDGKMADMNRPKTQHAYFEIAADPNAAKLFLAAGKEGVLMSTDGGDTWTVSLNPNDPNLMTDPNTSHIVTIDVCDADPNVIYCASGRRTIDDPSRGCIYRSVDGGRNWSKVMPFPSFIQKIVAHPLKPLVVYVALNDAEMADQDGGVYVSGDGGNVWQRLFPQDPNHTTASCVSVALHPRDPNVVYCLVNERYSNPKKVPGAGVYVKRGDADWQDIDSQAGSDEYALRDLSTKGYCLSLHPRTGSLYVGTSAGAFWRPQPRRLTLKVWPDDANDPNFPGTDWGVIEPEPNQAEFPEGTEVKLTASPNRLKKFVCWGGDLPASVDPYSAEIMVPMDTDKVIWAYFKDPVVCGSGVELPLAGVTSLGATSLLVRRNRFRMRARCRDIRAQRTRSE